MLIRNHPFLSRCHAPDSSAPFVLIISRDRRILRTSRLRNKVLLTLSFQIWYFMWIFDPKILLCEKIESSPWIHRSRRDLSIGCSFWSFQWIHLDLSKMDPSRSKIGHFEVSNEVFTNSLILVNFIEFCNFVKFCWIK